MEYKTAPWDLSEITPKDINKTFKTIERHTNNIVKKKKLLTNSISTKTFLDIVKQLENLRIISAKLGISAHLAWSANAEDQKAAALASKVENFLTKQGNKLIFFSLWFKKLSDKKAKQLIAASGKYHYHFEMLRKRKKHTLEENEEKIINIKDTTGASALTNIYNILTSKFEYDFQGEKRTQEEMVTFVRSSSSKTRKEAYLTLFKPYQEHKDLIGEIYKNLINDWREESVNLRGYKDPINVRNSVNDIPDKAIQALLNVCAKNEKMFHKFFEIKRKKLKLQKLRRFDIYAPLKEEKETISYNKAVNMVLETFEGFAPEFHAAASNIINQNHIHSNVQKGKRSGAFCCPTTTQHSPYVLLSYTGKYRDVSTLAHELGHGIHMSLANMKQTEFTADACLPLAETASIFSEMLLSEKVMKDNPKAAKNMLFTKLDDLYASIIRQAGFVRFEIQAHEMMKEGKTIDEMSDVYLKMLKKQLGPKVEVDDIYKYEWAYIPHIFHTPFYCYAYAFGNLLTLAIYEMYKEKGPSFARKVIHMLEAGGSCEPVKIAKIVGADITSEAFWQKGFDVIKDMIKQVE
ncbi:M3 family oligoendopeptidase [Candidatus Woesearchaeota archaeon]|jgi:oligoendopeptidase F|nr:M3 family oligoendopeptidase [Candidatus Woesearchaeota archaeon]MBT4151374.1 M3 family oligoendopeptidase [Candidatus Woesearchaeota archaeon]MBT4247772.1 M3 family oligoendopeptidase [Candidatus Woesearchaeota archaeon]MBT4434196.1 M3 family oligoendopeptidase [Candidatus Woesearchaeota archaeon]MBT7332334.1 M3 family oligoendopeptidase [Candidatus Woesearchaeota archaeon]